MIDDHALLESRPPMAMIDLPSNIELEAVILGAMMCPGGEFIIEYCADRMSAATFYEPVHGRIFEAIQRQFALGKSTSPVVLKSYFDGDDGFEPLGGVQRYLASLTGDPSAMAINHKVCADELIDFANRRRIMTALREAYEGCADLANDLPEVVSRVDAAMEERRGSSIVEADAAQCMEAVLADLEREHVGVFNRRVEAIDDLIGALEPKSLTILAARPGMGKTAVATNYAVGAAREGHGVCFVSLEMSREQLAGRMLADVGFDNEERRVPYTAIQKRTLNPWQRERVNEIAKWIAKLPLSVVDAGTLTMSRLDRLIRSQKRRMAAKGQKLDLVIVDYLQLLNPDDNRLTGYQAITQISMRLKAIAKDRNVAVLALAQLSRAVESRQDKRPVLSDLKESGQIEQDADAVVFLLREEQYLRQSEPQNDADAHERWQTDMTRCQGVIEFIAAKVRHGTTGTAKGRFYGPYQAVR